LIEAVRLGDAEVCRVLLDRGADAVGLRGGEGLNAVELAWCHWQATKQVGMRNTRHQVGFSVATSSESIHFVSMKGFDCLCFVVDGLVGKLT